MTEGIGKRWTEAGRACEGRRENRTGRCIRAREEARACITRPATSAAVSVDEIASPDFRSSSAAARRAAAPALPPPGSTRRSPASSRN